MRRFTRECVSEHHSLYSSFCQFLSAAFVVVDHSDLQKLKETYTFCRISPANPTKQHIREHCRTKVPQPIELLQRVEDVLHHYYMAKDANDLLLFKDSMLKVWRIQRIHILQGCLSDPDVGEGILYRYGGTLQLNYNKGEGAAVPVWIPVRGTSQQEGFHGHQAQWLTGNRVSCELFQAQAMTGVVRWNYQRLVDLKQPDVELPAVFDPRLISELNTISVKVTGRSKYPALQLSNRDTGEIFGLQYVEPGCRPVVLNWDKNRAQPNNPATVAMETEHHCPAPTVVVGTDSQESCADPVGAVPILSSSSRQSSEVPAAFDTSLCHTKTRAFDIYRFCHQPLKQGLNSPHTHASFPGVPGKYIYCPSRVVSLYNAQGMEKEMTWPDFQQSDFYDAERDRWIADKRKP
ncbi:hypothetical protein JOQ06_022159 [Pogonophryne albipinna]|uniref:Uncharacterized protein n=1 Tax=Pogonophryne albipinna TaxID=1090488 RepID=A0AAD6A5V7_9TELE|nr:hypothetical protein JOQ06_022159 [Pogonophryne albipinna]